MARSQPARKAAHARSPVPPDAPPAWLVALANAPEDDEPLSAEESQALEEGLAELRSRGIELASHDEIESMIATGCELEAP